MTIPAPNSTRDQVHNFTRDQVQILKKDESGRTKTYTVKVGEHTFTVNYTPKNGEVIDDIFKDRVATMASAYLDVKEYYKLRGAEKDKGFKQHVSFSLISTPNETKIEYSDVKKNKTLDEFITKKDAKVADLEKHKMDVLKLRPIIDNLKKINGNLQKYLTPPDQMTLSEVPPAKSENPKLGAKYQWPSDHLPISGSVSFPSSSSSTGGAPHSLQFVSYNVLNTAHMHHITGEDKQGLKGSMITELNSPPNEIGLTKRDEVIINQVLDMLDNKENPKDFLALQECSENVYKALEKKLAKNFQIRWSGPQNETDRVVCIYNKNKLELKQEHFEQFRDNVDKPISGKYIIDIRFIDKASNQPIRFINTHLQQGYEDKLIDYIKKNPQNGNPPVILMGDMNCKTSTIEDKLKDSGLKSKTITNKNPTNLNLNKQPVDYDQAYCIRDVNDTTQIETHDTSDQVFSESSTFAIDLAKVKKLMQVPAGPIVAEPAEIQPLSGTTNAVDKTENTSTLFSVKLSDNITVSGKVGDITKSKSNYIADAGNVNPEVHGELMGKVMKAAGGDDQAKGKVGWEAYDANFFGENAKQIKTGEVVLLKPNKDSDLAKNGTLGVLHGAGPDFREVDVEVGRPQLKQLYANSLTKVLYSNTNAQQQLKEITIAFPLISTGVFKGPLTEKSATEVSMRCAKEAISEFIKVNESNPVFKKMQINIEFYLLDDNVKDSKADAMKKVWR